MPTKTNRNTFHSPDGVSRKINMIIWESVNLKEVSDLLAKTWPREQTKFQIKPSLKLDIRTPKVSF